MKRMVFLLALVCTAAGFGVLQAAAPDAPSGMPQYSGDNHLLRPENYREWIYLSSGMNMNYGPAASDHDMFTTCSCRSGPTRLS